MSSHFLAILIVTFVGMLMGAGFCHLVPRLGPAGEKLAAAMCRAPGLDLLITYFTVAPMIAGICIGGWRGWLAGVIGQVAGMNTWEFLHELRHREAMRGPRILRTMNRKVGPIRNSIATWTTAFATPLFWFVRIAELMVYPPLIYLVGLPKYDHAEWVNVSRQKFSGLVGHDLIWCLYCDWMTGIWSLGTEMLRNVESMWCPIRFISDKKCDNCAVDFPDINNGWVPANGTMADVIATIERHYPDTGAPLKPHLHPWFGHPVRLTVKGVDAQPASNLQ